MITKKPSLLIFLGLAIASNSYATDWTTISNMSQLKYQIYNEKVWIRNMNEFDSSWLGCCYAYYIDITTNEGKALWSTMLAKIAMAGKFNVGVADKTVEGSLIYSGGEW